MAKPLDQGRDIDAAVEALLARAGVVDVFPTPVEDLVAAAGLVTSAEHLFDERLIQRLDRATRRAFRSAMRKMRGLLDRPERVIHISEDVTDDNQRRFITCHEITHEILPWQRDLLAFVDTNTTLAPNVEKVFEREANYGGAGLLFQGNLLTRVARDHPVEFATVAVLATKFGASLRATFRRWIETNPDQIIAGFVLDPVTSDSGSVPRREINLSPAWIETMGTLRLARSVSPADFPLLGELMGPWPLSTLDHEMQLIDRNGQPVRLRVQSYTTRFNTFVLLWHPTKERLLARRRSGLIVAPRSLD